VTIDADRARALAFAPTSVTLERGRLRFFARAIGETNPVYCDVRAAQAAGHPDLPAPPTFLFSLELEAPEPFAYLTELGIDLRQVLHAEQSFAYRRTVYAGDTVTVRPKIVDVFSKRGGALAFLVKKTDISCGDDPVAEATSVIVVRDPRVVR
jgi:acyl dehydratase